MGANGAVTVGGVPANVTTWSADEIVLSTPKLLPGNHELVVNVDGDGCPHVAK